MILEEVANRLLTEYSKPNFDAVVEELSPHLTVDLIKHLKTRVDDEKLKDAHNALHIATLAQSLYPHVADTEAEALAHWAKGSALLHLSQFQQSLDYYQKSATIYSQKKDFFSLVGVKASMVPTLRNLGNHHAALQLAKETRVICLKLGSPAQRSLAFLEANVGVTYRQLGDPESALAAYKRAHDIFTKTGDKINAARTDINRSQELRDMSRFVAAQDLLQNARTILAQTGQHEQQVARVDGNLAVLASQRGRYQEALTYFESARKGFSGMATQIALVDLRRSLIYRKINLIKESIDIARRAEPILSKNGMVPEQAHALYQQGLGYHWSSAYQLASDYLLKARQLLEQQGMRAILLELDYHLANLAYDRGQFDIALQQAKALEKQISSEIWPRLAAQVQLLLAQCALKDSQLELTHVHTQAALTLANAYSLRDITITGHHLIGQALENVHEIRKAWEHYKTAIQFIESFRVQLLVDEFRIGFMDDKLSIYEDTIRLSQQIGTPAQVLYTLNLAYTAPLLFKDTVTDFIDPDLQQKLVTLREQWHWYQNKLEEASNSKEAATTVATLRPQLTQIESQLAEIARRWQVRHTPDLTDVQERDALGEFDLFDLKASEQFFQRLQDNLAVNEALLNYYLIKDTFYALIVTKQGINLLPSLTKTKSLARFLNGWRFHLTQSHLISQTPESARQLAQRYLARLHQALIAPLQPYLAGKDHLFVVMPPGWHDIPLAASFDGQNYLIESYQLTYISTPEVLLSRDLEDSNGSNVKSNSKRSKALIVGHSDGRRLTGTLQAAKTVAATLESKWETTLLMDNQATIDHFKKASRDSELIHLATHATFRADNPLFSWIRLAEHRLTVIELYQMKLPQNPLVVLSACETGKGQARGGGLLGMGRALLAAGASGIVVTLWRVEDQATANLMTDFYEQLNHDKIEEKAASALRQAQLIAIHEHRHPFFWAGFIFIKA